MRSCALDSNNISGGSEQTEMAGVIRKMRPLGKTGDLILKVAGEEGMFVILKHHLKE